MRLFGRNWDWTNEYLPSFVSTRCKKTIKSLPKNTQKQIDIALLSLTTNPRPSGVKKLRGKGNEWRIRVGKYRIVYEIYDEKLVIRVIEIDHRKNVY